jgi:hypothetical protein
MALHVRTSGTSLSSGIRSHFIHVPPIVGPLFLAQSRPLVVYSPVDSFDSPFDSFESVEQALCDNSAVAICCDDKFLGSGGRTSIVGSEKISNLPTMVLNDLIRRRLVIPIISSITVLLFFKQRNSSFATGRLVD